MTTKRGLLKMFAAAPAAIAITPGEHPEPTSGPLDLPNKMPMGEVGNGAATLLVPEEELVARRIKHALQRELDNLHTRTVHKQVWSGKLYDPHGGYSHYDSFKSMSSAARRFYANRDQERRKDENSKAAIAEYKRALSIEGRLDNAMAQLFGVFTFDEFGTVEPTPESSR